MRRILVVAIAARLLPGPAIQTWVADPHHRVYPGSFGRDLTRREIQLEGARNERVVFQLALKSAPAATNTR